MDFGVTAVCLTMAMTSSCKELFAVKPQHRLMSRRILAPILFYFLFVAVNQGLAVWAVKSMHWSDMGVQQVKTHHHSGIAYSVIHQACFAL